MCVCVYIYIYIYIYIIYIYIYIYIYILVKYVQNAPHVDDLPQPFLFLFRSWDFCGGRAREYLIGGYCRVCLGPSNVVSLLGPY